MYFLCINTLDYANFILPDVPPNEREKLQFKKKKNHHHPFHKAIYSYSLFFQTLNKIK